MSSGERLAVYPGSFDPITNGHVDILKRSLEMFDKVVVAIAHNVRKSSLFTVAERKAHILAAVGNDPRVEVDAFEGLLIEYVKERKSHIVVRGLRALSDFEYEFQLAHMNRRLGEEIDTVFLMTSAKDFSCRRRSSKRSRNLAAMFPVSCPTRWRQRSAQSSQKKDDDEDLGTTL